MSSRKGGNKPFPAASAGRVDSSMKGKSIDGSGSGKGSLKPDQLSHDIADLSVDSQDGGNWEAGGKKNRNQTGFAAVKQGGSSNSAPKGGAPYQEWGSNGSGRASGNNWAPLPDSRRPAGRGNPRPQQQQQKGGWEAEYMVPQPVVRPPLTHGWQWSKDHPSGSQIRKEVAPPEDGLADYESDPDTGARQPDGGSDDDDDMAFDSDDYLSDDCGSDVSQKSHETRKKNKWFKSLFEALDKLTVAEINEQTRQWHCPACQNGPGAIEWYKGLQPLITHAKTKGSTRAKLHRELAALLEAELSRRGTSVIPAGEQYGQWKGLREVTDHEIVWPPMVIIMNTTLDKDENDKWIGMGNQELLEYFKDYDAKRARHSYGPQGHRGMSLLQFDATSVGYMEAERLHKHFVDQGTDRDAWDRRRVRFIPGGRRQLYGYVANKEDMERFNQHCQGKSRLKYEMRSYQEMVVIPMKQMSEDNQNLHYLKNKVVKQELRSKALEETFGVVSQKLRETMEENRIVRQRTQIQHEEHKEEMEFQERFFKQQIEGIQKTLEEKEQMFEKLLQEDRAKAKQSDVDTGCNEDCKLRKEEIAKFLDSQVKGVKEFEAAREQIIRLHEEKKKELQRWYLEKEVELEKEFDADMTKLMEKYKPDAFQASAAS